MMGRIKDDKGYNQVFAPSRAQALRTERRCDAIISQIAINNSTSILEIGCGTGENSFLLAKKTRARVLGIDMCAAFIDEANKKYWLPNLSYETKEFGSIASTEKFDYIVGNGILHHLYHGLDDALKQILNMLSSNGKIVFWEPNLLNPYCYVIFTFPYFRKKAKLDPDEMAFSSGFISRKLFLNGFNKIEVQYRDFLLPNTPDYLIQPLVFAGNIAEQIPLVKLLSQSLFITAQK